MKQRLWLVMLVMLVLYLVSEPLETIHHNKFMDKSKVCCSSEASGWLACCCGRLLWFVQIVGGEL
ncbi:hypothetical protein ACSBR1_013457 [Camellia fascicularis]